MSVTVLLQGFHAANRIGILKNDSDIDVTWEGDNTVLLQVLFCVCR